MVSPATSRSRRPKARPSWWFISCARRSGVRFWDGSGGFFASGALNTLRRKLDPRAANGGIFLGLNGVVVKSHGGTDALGFASAIDMAIDMARAEVDSRTSLPTAPRWRPDSRRRTERPLRERVRSQIVGCGAYLARERSSPMPNWPGGSIPSDEWIVERTGIRQPPHRRQGEMTSDLALKAARSGARGRQDRGRRARPHRRGDDDARRNLSRHRHAHPGAPRHDARRRVRRAGGVLGLRLCACRSPTISSRPGRRRPRW